MKKLSGTGKLLTASGNEAAAKANLATLEAVKAYIAEALRYNDFSAEDLDRHLSREITAAKKAITKAGADVLSARITQEIERVAGEYGAIDPGLTAAYIESLNTVRAVDDSKGNVTGIIIESKGGEGETLEEHTKRLRIASDTSMLFTTDQSSQSAKKALTNPWKKESFNLTLQGQIVKGNPELAARMKAEAASNKVHG